MEKTPKIATDSDLNTLITLALRRTFIDRFFLYTLTNHRHEFHGDQDESSELPYLADCIHIHHKIAQFHPFPSHLGVGLSQYYTQLKPFTHYQAPK